MNNKEIQRRRMMSYFIEAARKMIDTEGIEHVNLRDVANLAGYNSATMYHYFQNLDDLIYFTALGYLKEYTLDIKNCLNSVTDSLERYLGIWRSFCGHSFRRPQIYHTIFFEKQTHSLNMDIETYYSLFPEELGNPEEDLRYMLLGNTLLERNLFLFKRMVKDGFVQKEHVAAINEMTTLTYHGMLCGVRSGQLTYSAQQATDKVVEYIIQTLKSYEYGRHPLLVDRRE